MDTATRQGLKKCPPFAATQHGPRERLLTEGAAVLSEAELVAILLRTGTRGLSAFQTAQSLLERFGNVRTLLEAPLSALEQQRGVGPAKALHFKATLEIARRYLTTTVERGKSLTSPEATAQFLRARLRPYSYEVFAALFLDNRHRVIGFEELFRGTIDAASVYPREVVKRALDLHAAALIFTHNHPSGVAEPSASDKALTQRLKAALALVDIRTLDHIVVGDHATVSFAERGWL